jgi:hypothetical protein
MIFPNTKTTGRALLLRLNILVHLTTQLARITRANHWYKKLRKQFVAIYIYLLSKQLFVNKRIGVRRPFSL